MNNIFNEECQDYQTIRWDGMRAHGADKETVNEPLSYFYLLIHSMLYAFNLILC